MMKNYFIYPFLLFFVLQFTACKQESTPVESTEQLDEFDANATLHQIAENYKEITAFPLESAGFPRSINHGKLRLTESKNWCSGFYPGIWWMLYDYTKDETFAKEAEEWTWLVEKEKYNGHTHDMGFKIYDSFGWGYRLTQREDFKEVIVHSANTLATRFKPTVGTLRSWNTPVGHRWAFPVIIDNMMNLELLFAAAKLSGDTSLYNIAVSHADVTLKNHFRENGSSFHVLDYDTLTGKVNKKETFQGIADESSWARGQGWGLYGYTLMYRETKDKKYLDHANKIADYVIGRLPEDHVPFWDFDAPKISSAPRDASAGALYASALLELQSYVSGETQEKYLKVAQNILQELSSERYRRQATLETPFILNHATGHLPNDEEIDVPIVYADYYYVEALLRFVRL